MPAEVISTGIPQIDAFTGGLPRGAITEIFGPASSGRTSFKLSALAQATNHQEGCAVVDTNNSFDPKSAARAEIKSERLLRIRCANNLEHAFKATDLLLQGSGFGLVLLDLGDAPAKSAKRIISSWWYRFHRTLEATPTALVVIAEESCVRSCATLALELRGENCLWSANEEPRLAEPKKKNTRSLSPARHLSPVSDLLVTSFRFQGKAASLASFKLIARPPFSGGMPAPFLSQQPDDFLQTCSDISGCFWSAPTERSVGGLWTTLNSGCNSIFKAASPDKSGLPPPSKN